MAKIHKIEIECPICHKKGKLEVDEDFIQNAPKGVTAIDPPPNITCEHSYIVYVDKNLIVRDYVVADIVASVFTSGIEAPLPSIIIRSGFILSASFIPSFILDIKILPPKPPPHLLQPIVVILLTRASSI